MAISTNDALIGCRAWADMGERGTLCLEAAFPGAY